MFIVVISLYTEQDGQKDCELDTYYVLLSVLLRVVFSLKHFFSVLLFIRMTDLPLTALGFLNFPPNTL